MKQVTLFEYELKNDLKKFRVACGLSQTELAFKVGTSQNTISAIETGTYKSTSLLLALKIAHVLGYKVEDIFYLSQVYSNGRFLWFF